MQLYLLLKNNYKSAFYPLADSSTSLARTSRASVGMTI